MTALYHSHYEYKNLSGHWAQDCRPLTPTKGLVLKKNRNNLDNQTNKTVVDSSLHEWNMKSFIRTVENENVNVVMNGHMRAM